MCHGTGAEPETISNKCKSQRKHSRNISLLQTQQLNVMRHQWIAPMTAC